MRDNWVRVGPLLPMLQSAPRAAVGPTVGPAAGDPAATGHVPELDAVRAVAIGSVFCLHWLPHGLLVNHLQDQLFTGVHAFFVLSGYLITRVLLRSRAALDAGVMTRPHAFRQFFARRALRIFPVYYLALVAGAALGFAGLRAGFAWHASYLSNLYYWRRNGRFDGPASPFWTLAVEEQFYLVWPLVILLLPRRAVLPTTLATAAVGTLVRAVALSTHSAVDVLTPACANFLAAGAAVAVAGHPSTGSPATHRRVTVTFVTLGLTLAGVSLGLWAVRGSDYAGRAAVVRVCDQTAAAALLACGFDRLVRRGGVGGPLGVALRWRPLVYLGRVSYGLYAYHLFVTVALDAVPTAAAHTFAARLLGSVAVATASWYAMERPLNHLKRLFPYAP